MYYPDDIITVSSLGFDNLDSTIEFTAVDRLKKDDLHRVSEPIQIETTVENGSTVLSKSVQRTNYSEHQTNLVLPKDIQTLKGAYNSASNTLKERIKYHSYYANGNVKEVSKSDGIHILYIWGYNEQYPIAKIENATFTGLAANIQTAINSAVTASDNDIDTTTENTLRTALDTLRDQFPNAMVTTYTYDPLIGVTSITDPKGYTVYYHYDAFNRLEFIKDADGNLVSENKYNYKN